MELFTEKFNVFEKKENDEKKALSELDSLVKDLDEHCLSIMLFFRQNKDKSFGFNELLKKIEKEKPFTTVTFYRQTLSLHLKHLLKNNMLEVTEDEESNLKIKPRYYRLSTYWKKFFESFDGLKNYETISNEFRLKKTEEITASLIETGFDFCTRSFAEVILSPEYWGVSEARYYSNLVEKLAITHQKIVAEKNQEKIALQTLEEINILLSRIIRERYNLPTKKPIKKS